jgi:hypothetical protein
LSNEATRKQNEERINKMAFYIHLGCELSGRAESTQFIDRWIHMMDILSRLNIMETVLAI